MAQIKIYGDVVKGCIFFDGSTVEPKFLGTILAEVKSDETDRVVIYRTDREDALGNNRELFKRMSSNRLQNEAGEDLVAALGYTTAEVVAYINEQANLTAAVNPVVDTSLNGVEVNFSLDATSTSVVFDNGYQYGVNTIQAVDTGDGLITIKSIDGARTLFTELDHTSVDVNGSDAVGGLNDVINVLNELFTVGAFESVIISDPYATMVADTTGVVTTETNVIRGDALEIQPDEYGATVSGYNKGGYITPEVINQAGEYFTFDIRNEGIMGFGLVVSDDDFADGKFNGNSTYADPSGFCSPSVANSGNYGYQFSHWFHPSPNGPWTNYGANVAYSMREGWNTVGSKFNGSEEGAKWLNGDVIRMRVGINENNFIVISYFDESTLLYVPIARTTYAVPNGNDFHLGIKFGDSTVRLVGLPKIHLLATDYEEPAPTMYFRYIESPDGVFHYPLFTTAEEANYYDKITNGGDGFSHTHTYADDATNTTWYMPAATHDAAIYTFSVAPNGTDTFSGNVMNYTEITSLTDSDLTPTQFVGSDLTQEEGTNVNAQVTPAGATWSTSVDISPLGSGLVYDGYSLVQGTLTDVGADTVYTVTVTRANSYGSSVGSFTITATDVVPVSTLLTNWTKAVQMSGAYEYMKQVSTSNQHVPIQMAGYSQTVNAATAGKTSADQDSRAWNATSVFYYTNNKVANIWSVGEGQGLSVGNKDVISLQMYSGKLVFNWGRNGAYFRGTSQMNFIFSNWYGIYMSHDGMRAANGLGTGMLDASFKFKVVNLETGAVTDIPMNWSIVGGGRMTRQIESTIHIGRQHADTGVNNADIKTASLVVNALSLNTTLPTDTEISMMTRDPQQWRADYKIGQNYRKAIDRNNSTNFQVADNQALKGVQIWLMGDNNMDSYANGVRNTIQNGDQNFTKLQLNSLVSNDIETVNINGLT